MRKVLVTGATGFLGCNLVRYLNRCGIEVTIFRRLSSSISNISDCIYDEFVGELENKEDIIGVIKECDAVFHLAACTSLLARDKELRWKVNVEATKLFIEALFSKNDIRLVYCSSVGAIGFSSCPLILNEDSCFNAHQIDYFLTKKKAEEMVVQGVRQGLNAVIVNPGTLIGTKGMIGMQKEIFRKIASGKMLFYPPGGSCYTYVEDAVKGMVLACRKGKVGERYILGGLNITFKGYFDLIALCAKSRPPKIRLPKSVLPLFGIVMEYLFEKIGKDTGKLAAGFGYYSSEKAESQLNYQITPINEAVKHILSELRRDNEFLPS